MTERQSPELELDRFIDDLNREEQPEPPSSPEMAGLFRTVRAVRSLRTQAEPSSGFEERLLHRAGRKWLLRWGALLEAGLVAALVVVMALLLPRAARRDEAAAMAQAAARATRYHAQYLVSIMRDGTAADAYEEEILHVWVDGNRYAYEKERAYRTVYTGELKWQLRIGERLVVPLPAVRDRLPLALNLREEAEKAVRHPHRLIGHERVWGREAAVIEVTPPGEEAYRIWMDQESRLPIKLALPKRDGVQITYTFMKLEPDAAIDPALFTYRPEGYREASHDLGQVVFTEAEAEAVAGFAPRVAGHLPRNMIARPGQVHMVYGDAIVTQALATSPFAPAQQNVVGTAAGGPVEQVGYRLRWRQGNLEMAVEGIGGGRLVGLARRLAPDLTMTPEAEAFFQRPEVTVPVSPDDELGRLQAQVDQGHETWRLDPVLTAMEFLSSRPDLRPPSGVQVTRAAESTEHLAVVSLDRGPVQRVYLRRLLRQNPTGIWTIVGYDRR
jgi:outer membrane lipoprotein-sorting protein